MKNIAHEFGTFYGMIPSVMTPSEIEQMKQDYIKSQKALYFNNISDNIDVFINYVKDMNPSPKFNNFVLDFLMKTLIYMKYDMACDGKLLTNDGAFNYRITFGEAIYGIEYNVNNDMFKLALAGPARASASLLTGPVSASATVSAGPAATVSAGPAATPMEKGGRKLPTRKRRNKIMKTTIRKNKKKYIKKTKNKKKKIKHRTRKAQNE